MTLTETEIAWVEPPSRNHKKLDPRWAIMKANPGKWCLWKIGASQQSPQSLRHSHPDFTILSRNGRVEQGRNVVDIYISYPVPVKPKGRTLYALDTVKLQKIADIANSGTPFVNSEIRKAFGVSARTASRWIAVGREQGYIVR